MILWRSFYIFFLSFFNQKKLKQNFDIIIKSLNNNKMICKGFLPIIAESTLNLTRIDVNNFYQDSCVSDKV